MPSDVKSAAVWLRRLNAAAREAMSDEPADAPVALTSGWFCLDDTLSFIWPIGDAVAFGDLFFQRIGDLFFQRIIRIRSLEAP